ncbi:MAG: hypothetical protein NVV82_05610 [Sporocytophaga sp.]|nr:hypothetical protein [Sporocytophaga sp.]
MKQFIKALIKRIPIAFTQNQKYDRDTKKVIELVCKENSNCIDIGCHKGEILDLFIKHSPSGRHMAFEPIPMLFEVLEENYRDQNVSLYKYALSEKKE